MFFLLQMAYYQVVRMTRCETTTGHPELLRDLASYLGFLWHPEYRVYEHFGVQPDLL